MSNWDNYFTATLIVWAVALLVLIVGLMRAANNAEDTSKDVDANGNYVYVTKDQSQVPTPEMRFEHWRNRTYTLPVELTH